jgi:insertion element IS1 protein InsB
VDRVGKRVLGFTLGDRSAPTGDKLYKAIACIQVESYYTDCWGAYESVLYKEQHMKSKAETYTVERMNSLLRHYLARFKRRSQCYAKSIAMIAYSRSLLLNNLKTMRH